MVIEAALSFLKSCSVALRLPWNVMAVAWQLGGGHLPKGCPLQHPQGGGGAELPQTALYPQ